MKFIKMTTLAGMDWHDICSNNEQFILCNSPEIFDTNSAIYAHMLNTIGSINMEHITKAILLPNKFTYEQFLNLKHQSWIWESEDYDEIRIEYDKKDNLYVLEMNFQGGYSYRIFYDVYETENPVYIPVAKYFRSLRDGDTQERFFCKNYFTEYRDAIAFMKQDKLHRNSDYAIDKFNDYQIMVFDKDEILTKKWFQMNRKINQDITDMYSDTTKQADKVLVFAEYNRRLQTDNKQ